MKELINVKTWGILNQGVTALTAKLQKNVLTAHEAIEGEVHIDNSLCKVRVSKITFSLQQVLRMNIGQQFREETNTIWSQDIKGPPALHTKEFEQALNIDLSELQYEEVDKFKQKKGIEKPLDIDDKFQMQCLQASCHTPNFSINYYLSLQTTYSGCICCFDLPEIRININIMPIINPATFGFEAAEDFQPEDLGTFTIEPIFEQEIV